MKCYECARAGERAGERQDAIGVCHHCSVGVCDRHACVVDDPVTMNLVINRAVVLPLKARLLLCKVCLAALEQERTEA